jgi:hypothetical protein
MLAACHIYVTIAPTDGTYVKQSTASETLGSHMGREDAWALK